MTDERLISIPPPPRNRSGGRLLLLAGGARAVEDALGNPYNESCWRPWKRGQVAEPEPGWAPQPVNIGGLLVQLFFLERTAQPMPVRVPKGPPPGGAAKEGQREQQQEQKEQRKEAAEGASG